MDLIWTNLRIPVEEGENVRPQTIAHKLKIPLEALAGIRVIRRSLDARKKPDLFFVYTLQFSLNVREREVRRLLARVPEIREVPAAEPLLPVNPAEKLSHRPVVVGTGPAGYFAALALAQAGYRPLVLERGDSVELRSAKVRELWTKGRLDPECNVQFGEGGAGTFSDGKLTTRIHDRRIHEVLGIFVRNGAPEEIRFLAKPHVGTDILKNVVRRLREEIIGLGGEVRFRSRLSGLHLANGRVQGIMINEREEIPAEAVILAVGHSARDVYRLLYQEGLTLEPKAFAVGLRAEHPQRLINLMQYGTEEHPLLGPADYQLTFQDGATGRGAYAFCMCPGGKVVAAASEAGGVVTNGMSEYRRDTGRANSAIVVTVGTEDFASAHPLAGIEFQRYWEKEAFLLAGGDYRAPAQRLVDFLHRRVSDSFELAPSYEPGIVACDLHKVLPRDVGEVLERAFLAFEAKMPGFVGASATLTGVETRTSSPVRIVRDERGEALNLSGLYPAGEGAGYAGGIMSAAVDGLRAAERVQARFKPA
ncbi:Pyridine nucleotide disulphide reductase class-I [Acididesulfobacillus acetoxydans]|uniref:FAD dependent oxidoreductase n=1 Tax=Acididesulfobacillus acetoxydans TaxID=1561005 RepID=A0A8S0WWK6_9FIRM|nr:FAD-dependent oxidoreductase [Acididesulfobacillus acetoxydans]CAA7600351.1 Pyridine nucleotide disulphide reductase class-I [Acididesulfobacillus acetoxydans]CEJ07873.1 FAD dependent oxidoreductase [Acididesulfobacillus acetoxydans]